MNISQMHVILVVAASSSGMVVIYGVGFQFAWGTIPWIYPAEIFSMSEKASAVSLAVTVNYVANAVVVYITPAFMRWSIVGTLQLGQAFSSTFCMLVDFHYICLKVVHDEFTV